MIKVDIKPLSVNQVWQGKRFKTPAYSKYEKQVLLMLPKIKIPESPFKLLIELGFSSPLADIDNPLKPILDILQKKYSINDKDIFELNVKKEIVKKGMEYFKFKINHYEY
jgi:Holliday junction resolvase RusA-like endonuclease